jgi:hypothetical protein
MRPKPSPAARIGQRRDRRSREMPAKSRWQTRLPPVHVATPNAENMFLRCARRLGVARPAPAAGIISFRNTGTKAATEF